MNSNSEYWHGHVSSRKNKPVSIKPVGIIGVKIQMILVQYVCKISAGHWPPGCPLFACRVASITSPFITEIEN